MIVVKELFRILSRCVPAILMCLVSALLIYADVVVFDRDCPEVGVVELTQSVLILGIVVALSVIVSRRPDLRACGGLAVGFFLDIFIREQDAFLDHVCHGFWACPALGVASVCILLTIRCRATLASSFAHIRNSRHFNLLALGLSVLLVFSRIFGNKIIWHAVVGYDDFRVAKHVAEEGTELLAYAILCLWAISYCRECIREVSGGDAR